MPAKVTKLIGLKRPPFLSPTNLIIFACTQNGELKNLSLAIQLIFSGLVQLFDRQFSPTLI